MVSNFMERGAGMKSYACGICGYVYDGEVPFDQLPEDYVCPVCGAAKDAFEEE